MIKNYNIVLNADDAVAENARITSRAINNLEESSFELDETTHIPHLTLLHIAFDEAVLSQVVIMLSHITENFEPFTLKQKKYRLVNKTWIDMSYELDEPLMKLHQAILAVVAPLRVRSTEWEQQEEWSDMSPTRQENLELYGSSEVASLYVPHLTLTRLRQPQEESVLEKLPDVNFSFQATSIALYELGEYGTCKNIIATCPLGERLL